ncbi:MULTISPECIES: hypothetical protein [Streptomyces]|uniref:Uncharacterized protein n=1 Tax=Streptomyces sp. 900129855 TaxID=3155129 RepID=A0ABV2ZN34_9ACTN
MGATPGTGGTGCGHAPPAFALTQCRSASPLVWSSLNATETDHWTGMAPAMLVIALGFGQRLPLAE